MVDAESWQKAQFSVAYAHAIATVGGCTTSSWSTDKDGVDLTLNRNGIHVDLQLKCSQSPRVAGDDYSFDLDVATYDKLRGPLRSAPGFLVLVVVPADITSWITHGHEQILLSCGAYYAQIQDLPAARGASTTTIRMPRKQRMDHHAVGVMFQLALKRLLEGVGQPRIAA